MKVYTTRPTNQPTNQPTDQPWLQLPITSWIDSRVKNLTYLWLFLPQLHVVYSQWITVVVIELLAWLLNCCVITELINIIFPDLYTQNTQINKKLTISLFYWEFFKNYTKFRRKRWGAVPTDHPQIPPSMIFESAPISIRFILAIFCKLLNTKFSLYKM